jgi:hypothetical protein
MNLDEQLLNAPAAARGKAEQDKGIGRGGAVDGQSRNASAERAGALRRAQKSENPAAKNRAADSAGQGEAQPKSLREAVLQNKKKREAAAAKEGLKEKATSAVMSPMRKGLSRALRQAWLNLISSFGLTLIWINAHVILGMIFGNKVFCKLGEEWGEASPTRLAAVAGASKSQKKSAKFVETVEPMGVGCLDLGCLALLIAVAVLVRIIVGVMTLEWKVLKLMFSAVWDMFKSFVT